MAIDFEKSFFNNYMDTMYPMQQQTDEAPAQDVMLASGPVTSDMPQTGVRVGRAGITPAQSAKAGGLDRPLVALLDTLAGALQGATAQTLGLPGDIRSIIDTIAQEGATKYLGERTMPTTTEMQQKLPAVIPQGVANQTEREYTAKVASDIGTFLPAPGLLDAPKAIKGAVQATKNMPVGMSTQMVGEGISDLGFYSAAKQAVDSIQQQKGTGEQFLKQIEKTPGVKPEEIKWTGLDDFLKSKKTVTKAEVQEYLDKNRVEVKEVRLGEQETYDPQRLSQLEEEYKKLKQHPIDDPSFGEEKYDEMIRLMNIRDRSTTDSLYASMESATRAGQRAQAKGMPEAAERYFREAELYNTRAEKLDLEGLGMDAPTKYEKYQLPGGKNYREILLTLPTKQTGPSEIAFKSADDVDNFLTDMSMSGYENLDYGRLNDGNVVQFGNAIPSNVMQIIRNNDGEIIAGKTTAGSTYGSPHFEQPNILAHMRVNDRVDADGKKVLFVEEVQSDWHQAGRKKGYLTGDPVKELHDYEKNLVTRAREAMKENALKDGLSEKEADDLSTSIVRNTDFNGMAKYLGETDQYTEIALKARNKSNAVPDAPFKTTWHELALKRAIQVAAEGGYDRIAFTTGKTQAERYDLSKQISRVTYTEAGVLRAYDKSGEMVLSKKLDSPDQIEDYIGKEPAKKLLEKEVSKIEVVPKNVFDGRELSGVDLQVGGEGMKGFYDQILPKFLDKYAKKWDAKVGTTQIRLASDKQDMADSELLGELGLPKGGKAMADVQYIDITPKMKESVLTKGQPLFAIGAGGAAVQQEENQ